MSLGSRIRQARKERGIRSQKALAELLRVDRAAVNQWENDRTVPEARRMPDLARVLGVTQDWLATGRGPKYPADESPAGSCDGKAARDDSAVLDRSALVACLEVYLEVLEARKLAWSPAQKAKRFMIVFERTMGRGRIDRGLISEAIDMLS